MKVCAVINRPFHKCYRLTFIVFILAVDLYKTLLVLRFYFDYYRPDLSADLTKKSSVFYEPCNEGYLSFLAHYWKQGLLKGDKPLGKLCKSWCVWVLSACKLLLHTAIVQLRLSLRLLFMQKQPWPWKMFALPLTAPVLVALFQYAYTYQTDIKRKQNSRTFCQYLDYSFVLWLWG